MAHPQFREAVFDQLGGELERQARKVHYFNLRAKAHLRSHKRGSTKIWSQGLDKTKITAILSQAAITVIAANAI